MCALLKILFVCLLAIFTMSCRTCYTTGYNYLELCWIFILFYMASTMWAVTSLLPWCHLMCNVTGVNLNTTKHKTALLLSRHSHIIYATLCSKLDCKQEIGIDHSTAMPRSKAHRRASRVALAVIWQLVALITSTHAQVGIHSTQDEPSDACT
jgi:hypothetical protein